MRFSGFLSFLFGGKPFSDGELAEVRGEVSFADAIEAHLAWKRRLIDALAAGKAERWPSVEEVGKDTRCTLGQWIHGTGWERYGNLRSFVELRDVHARFHGLAREIVEHARAGRQTEATRLLDGDFQRTSGDIIARIKHLSELFGS